MGLDMDGARMGGDRVCEVHEKRWVAERRGCRLWAFSRWLRLEQEARD